MDDNKIRTSEREALAALVSAVHDATAHVSHHISASKLYDDASEVAQRCQLGPLGVALAAVLALAAEHRRLSPLRGSLGADRSMMALALAVIERSDQLAEIKEVMPGEVR